MDPWRDVRALGAQRFHRGPSGAGWLTSRGAATGRWQRRGSARSPLSSRKQGRALATALLDVLQAARTCCRAALLLRPPAAGCSIRSEPTREDKLKTQAQRARCAKCVLAANRAPRARCRQSGVAGASGVARLELWVPSNCGCFVGAQHMQYARDLLHPAAPLVAEATRRWTVQAAWVKCGIAMSRSSGVGGELARLPGRPTHWVLERRAQLNSSSTTEP